jgi:hypothetical protein
MAGVLAQTPGVPAFSRSDQGHRAGGPRPRARQLRLIPGRSPGLAGRQRAARSAICAVSRNGHSPAACAGPAALDGTATAGPAASGPATALQGALGRPTWLTLRRPTAATTRAQPTGTRVPPDRTTGARIRLNPATGTPAPPGPATASTAPPRPATATRVIPNPATGSKVPPRLATGTRATPDPATRTKAPPSPAADSPPRSSPTPGRRHPPATQPRPQPGPHQGTGTQQQWALPCPLRSQPAGQRPGLSGSRVQGHNSPPGSAGSAGPSTRPDRAGTAPADHSGVRGRTSDPHRGLTRPQPTGPPYATRTGRPDRRQPTGPAPA